MSKTTSVRILIVVFMAVLTACTTRPSTTPRPQKPIVVGLADYHSHQFGHLGFGSFILSHSPDPTKPCGGVHSYNDTSLKLEDLVRRGLFAEAGEQLKTNKCFPTPTNLASQRMDTDNLNRAWSYGLRLLVVHAVSSELLCRIANMVVPCPSDEKEIDQQIKAAEQLQALIDAAAGGSGLGWYRIVTTPEEARDVISKGKLAVVLGVEASNAFGCRIASKGGVLGPAPPFGSPELELTYEQDCNLLRFSLTTPSAAEEDLYRTQKALALFEKYWKQGVRHFFPIHNLDGVAGGAAFSIPLLHADNNPSRAIPGDFFDRVPDIDRTLRAVRPPTQGWNCSSGFTFDGGRCNSKGLTDTGRHLVKLMASYGALIDIDHMSLKAKRELLSKQGLMGGVYPFISSHSGMASILMGDKLNEGQLSDEDLNSMIPAGGAFAPILPPATLLAEENTYPLNSTIAPHKCGGTSESYIQAYRYVVDRLKNGTLYNGDHAFIGVGFGTDFSAPVPVVAAPRFSRPGLVQGRFVVDPESLNLVTGGSRTSSGGHCFFPGNPAFQEPMVQYPITSPLAPGTQFKQSVTPWGGRVDPYDISYDGVVHIGMIPDFIEELRMLGLSDDELQPLWHGAEAYIRAWEFSQAWKGNFSLEDDKGINQICADLRAKLVEPPSSTSPAILTILNNLKQQGCHGT